MAALFALAALVLAASFGSWALSRWLGARSRPSSVALVFNGVGVLCLIVAAAIGTLAISRWSVLREMPVPASEQRGERAIARLPAPRSSTPSSAQASTAGFTERENNRIAPPRDADPIVQPPVQASPRVSLAEWDATGCVASKSAAEGEASLMFLDNECDGVIAIMFAACARSTATRHACTVWTYEPDGVVLTTPEQRPLMDRIGEGGPLIAPTYHVAEANDQRVRYLACKVREPEALSILSAPQSVTEERRQRLRAALERDACYARVLELTRLGLGTGRSPDEVLSGQL